MLVVLTALPHPLDPAPRYAPRPVRLAWMRAGPEVADDTAAAPVPRTRAASSTPNACTCEDATMSTSTATLVEQHARRRRCVPAPRHPGRRALAGRADGGPDRCASSTSRATRPSTRCSTAPTTRASATAPQRHASARQGNLYLTTGTRAACRTEGRADADHRRRHLRAPRHAGRRLRGESNTVRYALDKRYMHSCRDSFLLRAGAARRAA